MTIYMKRAFIYAAGVVTPDDISLYRRIKTDENDIFICADGGYDTITSVGIIPDVAIGDMDSVRAVLPNDINVIRHPKDKDKTDLHLCIDYALKNNCKELILLGALGGRVDHSLANIIALKYISDNGAMGMILTAESAIYITTDKIELKKGEYKYISLIPLSERVEGVTTKGLKYSLFNFTLKQTDNLGISNEFISETVTISVKKGSLIVICQM